MTFLGVGSRSELSGKGMDANQNQLEWLASSLRNTSSRLIRSCSKSHLSLAAAVPVFLDNFSHKLLALLDKHRLAVEVSNLRVVVKQSRKV